MVEPEPGVRLHYGLGDKPPSNACTGSAALASSAAPSGQQLAHFAIEAATPGYLALSFAETANRMYPADAVIAGSSADLAVRSYHITGYAVNPADETNGWVMHKGFINQAGNKILCFSRELDSQSAAVVKSINPTAGEAGGIDSCLH
jgi:hypothetical protein